MWLTTWSTLCLLVPWIVAGMIATGGAGSLWVSAGAVAIALIAPPAGYRYAKGAMLRLLYRLDPPSDFEKRSAQ